MYHMSICIIQSSDFNFYVTYCKNKPVSDHARSEYEVFFLRRQSELGQKLNIEDLLIAPVQRLPKYQLLIRVSGCGQLVGCNSVHGTGDWAYFAVNVQAQSQT